MTRFRISILIVISGLVASVVILTRGSQTIPTTPRSIAEEIKAVLTNKSTADTDRDGLFDWEESAIGSNPTSPDTDKDGYFDGEEVASGHSPLRQAPDDLERPYAAQGRVVPKTVTAAVSRRVASTVTESVAEALARKGRVGLKSPEEVAGLIDRSIPRNLAQELGEFLNPVIDVSRFRIEPQKSKEARERYLRGLLQLTGEFSSKTPDPAKAEAAVIAEALERSDFTKVIGYRDLYQKAEERLMKMAVPAELIPLHQEFFAIVRILKSVHQAVAEFETDPVKTSLALEALKEVDARFARFVELVNRAAR